MTDGAEPTKRCSFCRKNIQSVRYLVSAPDAAICDECVVLSMRILAQNRVVSWATLFGLLFS